MGITTKNRRKTIEKFSHMTGIHIKSTDGDCLEILFRKSKMDKADIYHISIF